MGDYDDVEIRLPVAFVVKGTPVSFQSKVPASKKEWKEKVLQGARTVVPEHKFACSDSLSITIYDFPDEATQGDVDNIIKLIQDALCPYIIQDDSQIKRVVAQRFEETDLNKLEAIQGDFPEFVAEALALGDPAFVYVRISDNLYGDVK